MSDDCFVLAELATGWQLHFQPWTGVARIQDGCSVINSISANLPTQLYPGKLTARNPKFLEGWLQIKRHNQLKQTLKFPSALLILKQLTPKEKKYLLISILAVVHDYYYFASPSLSRISKYLTCYDVVFKRPPGDGTYDAVQR